MRVQFLLNILLAIVWVFLTGTINATNVAFGFILSFLVLWLISFNERSRKYFIIAPRIISFAFYFLYELIKANLQVAADVVTPKFYMEPGIIKYPLDAKTDLEITLLANVITLTPGTLSLDVSDDRKVLYIHAMYVHDREEFIDSIKNGFEKRILKILR
ncbi:Na+/H+ antiporter subunit E [Brumimicrobium glaciale]|jgi:multicomponent Na+:H+ antiporter subunit E|uniref:Na+/H+ antiporter subunit E n=1 Tax=Brumimicrobium glaciale TaxID=200475 RepID=A0A4Q4KIP7_9FLAO|nr:Na+/H+ antiporter subunit E [Brumimicrobium glaciale]RYM32768.1 Na+/H+ antiporter subunit E [Brumimicrobium glaciale]